jgi:hypothetical protein
MNLIRKFLAAGACFALLGLGGCGSSDDFVPAPAQAQAVGFTIFSASGTTDVTTRIAEFQTQLGGASNGNTAGTQATGSRAVNWDAAIVPVFPVGFPGDFFNNLNTAPPTRGLIVGVSGNNMSASNDDFATLNPNYADDFNAFSTANTFAPLSSNVLWARFEVPAATGVAAGVTGFGAIFSDVDVAGSTTLEFFNGNVSLGTFEAPVRTDANGHSFLGVSWGDGQKVTAVKLTLGQAALGATVEDVSDGGANDLVIVDDFFYGEPAVVGTP